MNDLEKTGNLIEAVFWLLVSLVLLLKAMRAEGALRRIFSVLAGAFLVFSVSDVIESQTGAWWKPVWLLILKTACMLVFFFGFREYYRVTKRSEKVSGTFIVSALDEDRPN